MGRTTASFNRDRLSIALLARCRPRTIILSRGPESKRVTRRVLQSGLMGLLVTRCVCTRQGTAVRRDSSYIKLKAESTQQTLGNGQGPTG